ncbi:hypothetical protein Q7P37_007527 [Cladosporium fusiforme]
MQRYGGATRRFYAAFYQWTVRSGKPSRRCTAAPIVARRDESNRASLPVRNDSRPVNNDKGIAESDKLIEAEWQSYSISPKQLTSVDLCPIETTPEGSLKAWGYAVRQRAGLKVTVEISAPADLARDKHFMEKADVLKVKMNWKTPRDGLEGAGSTDCKFQPLLLTGTAGKVRRIWKTMYVKWMASKKLGVPVDGQLWTSAEEGHEKVARSQKPSGRPENERASAAMSQKPSDRADITATQELQSRAGMAHEDTRISEARSESSKFKFWTGFGRALHGGSYQYLLYLPERIWHSIDSNGGRTFLAEKYMVQADSLVLTDSGEKRCIGLEGGRSCVADAIRYLQKFATLTRLEADNQYSKMSEMAAQVAREDHDDQGTIQRSPGKPGSQHELAEAHHERGGKMPRSPRTDNDTQQYLPETITSSRDSAESTVLRLRKTRLVAFAIPDHLRQFLDPSENRTLKHIAFDAGLQELRIVRLAEAVDRLHIIGNDDALKRAERLLQRLLDFNCGKQGLRQVDLLDLEDLPGVDKKYGKAPVAESPGEDTQSQAEHSAKQEGQYLGGVVIPEDQENLRSALRHLTQPVALVTSTMPGVNGPRYQNYRGVTVSSFCTVTLAPKPIVSFNLRVPSRSWDAISASGRLWVHLLHATPEGAAAAHAFTQPYEQPHGPFVQLDKFPRFRMRQEAGCRPPEIRWDEAVHTALRANLLLGQCVRVGDHMVVLAEVDRVKRICEHATDSGLLAYGQRSYRELGPELKPLEIPDPETAIDGAYESFSTVDVKSETRVEDTNASNQVENSVSQKEADQPKDVSELEPSSPILDEESLRSQMEQTESSYKAEGFPNQTAAKEPMLEEALKAVSSAWEAPPDASSDPQQQQSPQGTNNAVAGESQSPAKPSNATAESQTESLMTSEDTPLRQKDSKGPQGASINAWGLKKASIPLHRSFSSWTQKPTRHYSTASKSIPFIPIPKKILKSTVADYLVQPQTHSLRWGTLFKTQTETLHLNEKLSKALEEDSLTAEQVEELENDIAAGERKVARMLAVRHAHDLKNLLDQGNIKPSRAQELEIRLEQGQAALLLEAKALRSSYDAKRVSLSEFEKRKALYTKDYETINAQLLRLRDLVEEDDIEDDDDGERRGVSEDQGREFDEFFDKADEKRRRRKQG